MNKEEIIKYWKLLRHEKQTEFRAINSETKEVRSYHFSTEEELLNLVEKHEGNFNLYLGVNERNPLGTSTEDIYKVGVIPLDIDCVNKPANDLDIAEASTIAIKIINDGISMGFKKPTLTYSGNGFQIYFLIPKIEINKDNAKGVSEKIEEFEKRLIKKYSTEKVRLDNVGDLPRIMRIAGTFNLKSKTTSKIIEYNLEEDEALKQSILNLKLSNEVITGSLSEELKDKIKNDEIIQKYMSGDLQGRNSRSEAELSLVCKLVQLNLNKEQIYRILASCKLGKWQEANIQYRNLTYRKAIELICKEKLQTCQNPGLNDLYLIYKKWLWLEDTKRIDIVLATYLTKFMEGTPIWLIIVGNSGDGKTEQVKALRFDEEVYILHNLTSRTLVSGSKKMPDLAPELDKKLVLIPDMAQILELAPQEKAELWGQLRDLYDGYAGKCSGMGVRTRYENLRITLIACSTPKIDGQILVHQDLGTRELIYRTEDTENKESMMEYAMRNEGKEEEMREEIKNITKNFLKDKRVLQRDLSEEEMTQLKNIAMFISVVRATADVDSYTNELRNIVYPEQPTRIVKQLKRLYLALISLEIDYPTERAFEILWHLAKSCAFPIRINLFEFFIRQFLLEGINKENSTNGVASNLHIGKRTALKELNTLWNMRILNKQEVIEGNNWNPTEYWSLNLSNDFIQNYIKFLKNIK